MNELKFPEGFRWGSATSAHQIEGNNHNDWSEWEKSRPSEFRSEKACDSYNRYEEDFDIAKGLNQNIHRFSIEWSRIEPKEGRFDHEAMHHYVNVVKALRARGLEPMVTLWHFTNPVWFAEKGGFLNIDSPKIFTRYVKYVVDNLKDRVGLWITFNEASSVYAGFSYMNGQWPPQHRNVFEYIKVRKNFIKAQALAYQAIKKIYSVPQATLNSNNLMSHNVEVGLVESNVFSAHGNLWHEKLMGKLYNYQRNLYFWDKALPYYDFLGLNYYHVDRRVPGSYRTLPRQGWMPEMGWEIYPKGIYHRLMELKKYKKPIFITENGIANGKDELREKFIKEHLRWVWQAIHDGADVHGYMYWSLLDNFEWHRGFKPKFGLVEVDFNTFARKVRPSALEYAKICKSNSLLLNV
ncbi:MAG: glycoside hydrolase family 1 protein [Patescibacteria group bacterium]